MSRNDTPLALHRLMLVTRAIDRALGAHDGHWHGLEGEEAVAAGAYLGLRPTDVLAPHYRGAVVAAYAKGADLRRVIAGTMGKATSYNRGRYRNDVCSPPDFNLIGLYSGSLGPPLTYATGAALAFKLDRRDDVAVAVFGDGTSSRGDCHEAMNLAGARRLPVVFVCQNNAWAISTPAGAGIAGSIAARGAGYGMPGLAVDGNDVEAVHEAVAQAIARARAGEGPSLIEARTYRVGGHFYADTEDYRDAAEVAAWRARDPIAAHRASLLARVVATRDELDALARAVEAEVAGALAQALEDPPPDPGDLAADAVFASPIGRAQAGEARHG